MIAVVAGHGFDDGPERHGAALRVRHFFGAIFGGNGCQESQIPGANRIKSRVGRGEIVGCIALRIDILIEGQKGGTGVRQGLAKTRAKHQFAVGKVRDDLAGRPFAGVERSFGFFCAENGEEVGERFWRFRNDRVGVLSDLEEGGVGIEGHAFRVIRPAVCCNLIFDGYADDRRVE